MPDYNKLTVIKLREELVKRGLPKSGLKPVLVNRLIEADAQTENQETVTTSRTSETSTLQHDHTLEDAQSADPIPATDTKDSQILPIQNEENTTNAPVPIDQAKDRIDGGGDTESSTQDVSRLSELKVTETANLSQTAGEFDPTNEPAPIVEIKHVIELSEEPVIQEAVSEAPDATSETEAAVELPAINEDAKDSMQPEPLYTNNSDEIEASDAINVREEPSVSIDASSTTPTKLSTRQETLEDTKKRKRRSQSPPPSPAETAQKRAKMEDSRPAVKLPEDTDMHDLHTVGSEQIDDTIMVDSGLADAAEIDKNSQPVPLESEGAIADSKSPNPQVETDSEPLPLGRDMEDFNDKLRPDTTETTAQPPSDETTSKPSPQDTRFKNLFTAHPKRSASPTRQAPRLDHEDRNISPALHPATSALYIRDFMRPLQPSALKEHLLTLAAPSSSDPSPQIITQFFLDPIRTHCLVGFASISAASRVRSSLHDRVWPDERTRRPLWVDFVPEEKLQKWIEVESEATGSRGQAAKRWEVVYEQEDGNMKAYLQEAGLGPRPTPSHPTKTDLGPSVSGAPSGPRARVAPEPRPPAQPSSTRPADVGKGFQALDDLFQSTTAKPKLYYLPVSKSVANRRLDRLDEGRGGGRGDELRRYTFEEGILVDRGPETPRRGRGGYGGRGGGYGGGHPGGYSGGYQGRDGGGYHRRGGGGYRGGDRRDWR